MIDLHHTTATLDYVSTQMLEDHLAAAVPTPRLAVAFDMYPPRPDEPTEL
ncbi:hypothetical protein [Oerskovia enterophila]